MKSVSSLWWSMAVVILLGACDDPASTADTVAPQEVHEVAEEVTEVAPDADAGDLAELAGDADADAEPDGDVEVSEPDAIDVTDDQVAEVADLVPDTAEVSDAGDGDASEPSLSPEALLALLEATVCELRARCEFVPDGATCLESLAARGGKAFGSARALVASIGDGSVVLDAARALDCVAAMADLSCGAATDALPEIPVCAAAFTGQVALGGVCLHRAACVAGTYCRRSVEDPCVGECVAVADDPCQCSGPLGDPLSSRCGFGERCVLGSGTVCDGAPATRCEPGVAPGANGEPCGSGGLCWWGLTCSARLCVPISSDPCSPLLGCPTAGEVCVLTETGTRCLPEKGRGEACTYTMECGGFMSTDGCDPATMTCQVLPGDGSPCLPAGPNSGLGFCDESSAYCDIMAAPQMCRAYVPLGASCASNTECGPVWGNVVCQGSPRRCEVAEGCP